MGNGRGLFLGFQVLPGNENLLLETPEIEVVEAHLPHQGHQHVPAILHRGLKIRGGGLHRAPGAPEKVQFPGRIQTHLE
jgi:hypothetical protein